MVVDSGVLIITFSLKKVKVNFQANSNILNLRQKTNIYLMLLHRIVHEIHWYSYIKVVFSCIQTANYLVNHKTLVPANRDEQRSKTIFTAIHLSQSFLVLVINENTDLLEEKYQYSLQVIIQTGKSHNEKFTSDKCYFPVASIQVSTVIWKTCMFCLQVSYKEECLHFFPFHSKDYQHTEIRNDFIKIKEQIRNKHYFSELHFIYGTLLNGAGITSLQFQNLLAIIRRDCSPVVT